jgi:hypothetical protein
MCKRRVGKRIGLRASQPEISHGKLMYEKKSSYEVNHQIDSSYRLTRKILSSFPYTSS